MNYSISIPQNIQYYRQQLPDVFVDFSSEKGKQLFAEAFVSGHMNSYFKLAAQFVTQAEPTYCGISTLVMALNTLSVDPGIIWKGVWRWYHESMLDGCVPIEVINNKGITFGQFICLANLNHLNTRATRVDEKSDEKDFRDIIKTSTLRDDVVIVCAYSRQVLKQAGDGHFSTIAGYHEATDQVLILDVARFKYPPHWMGVSMLFEAMKSCDSETGLPRGYVQLRRQPTNHQLLLFKISESLTIFTAKYEDGLAFINKWLHFLSQSVENTEISLNNVLEYVTRQRLKIVTDSSQSVTVFKTQITCDCDDELIQKCKELVNSSVASLKSSSHYETVSHVTNEVKTTNPATLEKIKAFGNADSFNVGFCSCACVLTEVEFLLAFLLSWPYSSSDSTIGSLMQKIQMSYMNTDLDAVIRNELDSLKNQFTIMLEAWKECPAVCHTE